MSGHNRWSQIKRQKGVTDAQKSKVFSKYGKLIAMEAKKAKGNRDAPGLRAAIINAKAENMPNETIERAIKKATESGAAMETVSYECYGPGGCAMIIEALTENRNKAAQEIKHILSKNGFELAAPGSAVWAFEKNPPQNGGGWTPKNTMQIGEEDSTKLEVLIDELEENDEVQDVFTNAE